MRVIFSALFAAFLGLAATGPLTRAVRPHQPAASAPALAMTTAGLLTALALRGGLPPPVLAALAALTVLGVALAAVDTAAHRLPDALVLPAYPLLIGALALTGHPTALTRALAASGACLAAYGAVHLVAPSALGFGDVKLAGLLALPLGWLGWKAVAAATVTTLAVGGLSAFYALRRGRSHVPYGPPLLVGAYLAVLAGLTGTVPRPGTRRPPADRTPPPA
ncbi:prepilin peptidase [Phytomonospora sp. NPDC050363]|uniref:prepilin peptidase n=1 Tax=Phytomonospora sp. NPDC050363 TaxID=3155642 RepID=UPI00340B097B